MTQPYSRHPQPNDPQWLTHAFGEIGTKEITGLDHHPRVLQYHACTGLGATDDETPWCSAFMCFVMQRCGIQSTRSAASLSWLRWGKALKRPVRGCIVVFERADKNGNIIPNRGHVGIWLGEDARVVHVLGGNQSNQVMISRYRRDRVIGYRWPTLPHNSTTNVASVGAGIGSVAAASPAIGELFNLITQSEAGVEKLLSGAQSMTTHLGLPVSSSVSVGGVMIAVAAAVYIIKERNAKIKHFGL